MSITLKKMYLLSALSLLAIPAFADVPAAADAGSTATGTGTTLSSATASTPSVVGNYTCQRVDPANASTTYPLVITQTNQTYTLEWDDANGTPVMYGTGIIHPGMTNVLSTSFWNPQDTATNGVEIFEIKPDGSLQGNWTLQSGKGIGSETCTKTK